MRSVLILCAAYHWVNQLDVPRCLLYDLRVLLSVCYDAPRPQLRDQCEPAVPLCLQIGNIRDCVGLYTNEEQNQDCKLHLKKNHNATETKAGIVFNTFSKQGGKFHTFLWARTCVIFWQILINHTLSILLFFCHSVLHSWYEYRLPWVVKVALCFFLLICTLPSSSLSPPSSLSSLPPSSSLSLKFHHHYYHHQSHIKSIYYHHQSFFFLSFKIIAICFSLLQVLVFHTIPHHYQINHCQNILEISQTSTWSSNPAHSVWYQTSVELSNKNLLRITTYNPMWADRLKIHNSTHWCCKSWAPGSWEGCWSTQTSLAAWCL